MNQTTKDAHPKVGLLKMSILSSAPAQSLLWLPTAVRIKATLLSVAFKVIHSGAPAAFGDTCVLSCAHSPGHCLPVALKQDKLSAASGPLHMLSSLSRVLFWSKATSSEKPFPINAPWKVGLPTPTQSPSPLSVFVTTQSTHLCLRSFII